VNDGAVFEDLLEESARGCPLCRRSDGSAKRFIATFAYELVNDPTMRAELRRSLGFCRRHAVDAAAQTGAPLALSIVCADLCTQVARRLAAGKPIRATDPCPACDVAAQREQHDLEVIGRRRVPNVCPLHPRDVPRRELPRGLAVGDALPVGELDRAAGHDPGQAERQSAAYSALQRRLEAVIRHHDYRFRDEPFDDFGVIWQALSLFSGTDPRRRPTARASDPLDRA
jgi:hypothetical protein